MENKYEKNKNIYLTTLGVITAMCIIIGTFYHIYGGFSWFGSRNRGSDKVENKISVSEDISAIELQVDIAELTIQTGKTFDIEYRYDKAIEPKIEEKDGVLHIKEKSNSSISIGKNSNKVDCKMVITVPEGKELEKITLNVDLGGIEIEGVDAGCLEIEADLGGITIKDGTFETVSFEADLGSIEMKDVEFTSGAMTADMGSIEMKNVVFDSANLTADMGSIQFEGDCKALTASCEMGSIEIETKTATKDLDLDLQTDLGSVTVNGEKRK